MNHSRSRAVGLLTLTIATACAKHSADIFIPPAPTLDPPVFATRVEIATGTDTERHADYVVADLNNDGMLDMAVISLTGELRILFGNAADFEVVQSEQIDGIPAWIEAGDLDNDGDLDLAIVRSDVNTTDIWRNDGGTFEVAATLPVGTDALALAVGDLDQDGDLDIAVSRPTAPEIVIAFGDGQLGFPNLLPISLPGGGTPFNLTIGDADRDGRNDLVVADTGSSSRLLLYRGSPTFGVEACQLDVPGRPGAVALGDLSGDGLTDLVVSAFDTNRYVVITDILPPLEPEDGGTDTPSVCPFQSFDVQLPARPSLATVADVTGDGINDLVACLAFNAVMAVGPGLTGGGVGPFELFDTTGFPLRPFVADFDNNGRNDVFALSGNGNRVNLWLSGSTGSLTGARNYNSTLLDASWLDTADFDGDGDYEVIAGGGTSTLALLGGAGGGLAVEWTIDIGLAVLQLEAGDLDGDGLVDLVIGVPGGIKVLRNQSTPGNPAFEVLANSPMSLASTASPFGIVLEDLDADGDVDIAVCDPVGGGLHLVPGTATAFTFDPEIIVNVGGGPVDVAAADFTGDGRIELAVSRSDLSDIVVLQSTGGLAFAEILTVPTALIGQSPGYLLSADFNRDGRGDLAVSNTASGTVSVLFGSSSGFSAQDFPAGATPTALLARDLTNDGIVDILVASLQTGDFRVLVGDGKGSFPVQARYPGTLGVTDAVLQDMTGNGQADLVMANLFSSRISLVRNITEYPPLLAASSRR